MLDNEERSSDSPYIACVWRGYSSGVERMTSVATAYSELVVWTHRGLVHAGFRGPETAASAADVPDDSESFGIVFSHGTSMPHLPTSRLVDTQIDSPQVSASTFVLRGEQWSLPDFENAEVFVARLVREGVLVRDPVVAEALAGRVPKLGTRSVQRRVVAATGLTQGAIRQIDRARQAASLLSEGVAQYDVIDRLGYYDQPHLARSLRRFIGRTATQLQRGLCTEPVSFLYKTDEPTTF